MRLPCRDVSANDRDVVDDGLENADILIIQTIVQPVHDLLRFPARQSCDDVVAFRVPERVRSRLDALDVGARLRLEPGQPGTRAVEAWSSLSGCHDRLRAGMSSSAERHAGPKAVVAGRRPAPRGNRRDHRFHVSYHRMRDVY